MKINTFGAFLCGAAIGSAITYIFLSRRFNSLLTEKVNQDSENLEENGGKKPTRPVGDWTNEGLTRGKTEGSEIENGDDDDENEEENSVAMMAEKERPSDEEETRPFLITEDQYSEEHQEFSKVTLIYYSKDGVLAEEDDSLLDNQVAVVGDDWIRKLSKHSPIAFVRNMKLGIDYEIDWDNRSYAVDIMGMDSDDV